MIILLNLSNRFFVVSYSCMNTQPRIKTPILLNSFLSLMWRWLYSICREFLKRLNYTQILVRDNHKFRIGVDAGFAQNI